MKFRIGVLHKKMASKASIVKIGTLEVIYLRQSAHFYRYFPLLFFLIEILSQNYARNAVELWLCTDRCWMAVLCATVEMRVL